MTGSSILTFCPLGSGGWIPANGQQTFCFVFPWGDEMVVIDAGTGIARLMGLRDTLFKSAWRSLRGAQVLLSHYHFDHVIGLFWLRGIFGNLPVTIYAPGEEVYGQRAIDLLNGLFRKPYSPHPFSDLRPNVLVNDLPVGGLMLETGPNPLKVSFRLNPNHSDPSVAFRFGDLFAVATDTPPEEGTIAFARGVKVLLHESWYDSSPAFRTVDDPLERHMEGPHTGSFGAGLIAKRAGVKRLYLVHHNPERSFRDVESDARSVSEVLGLDCRPARDLEEIEIS